MKGRVNNGPAFFLARWITAIERLNMTQTLQQAGYEDCLP
jgi:hypothetical protein